MEHDLGNLSSGRHNRLRPGRKGYCSQGMGRVNGRQPDGPLNAARNAVAGGCYRRPDEKPLLHIQTEFPAGICYKRKSEVAAKLGRTVGDISEIRRQQRWNTMLSWWEKATRHYVPRLRRARTG